MAASLLVILIAVGCQTVPKGKTQRDIVMYPPPPAAPRMQFLRAFSTRRDIGQQQYRWVDLLVGPLDEDRERFMKPYGIAVMPGKFYLCDTIAGTVWVVNFAQGGFQPIAGDRAQGKLRKPTNIAIDTEGRKYVADTVRNQVVVFGPNDEYVAAFGGPEDLRKPSGVAVSGERLIVTDVDGQTVQIRDKRTGAVLKVFGSPETANNPDEAVRQPTNVTVDRTGNIVVSDFGSYRIMFFSPEGEYLGAFGGLGRGLGEFAAPKGVAIDGANRIYVVDSGFENVRLFDEDHRLLMWFGELDQVEGALTLPAQVVIDYQNVDYFRKYVAPGHDIEYVVWVTSQSGPRLVSCYGFLKNNAMPEANVAE